ncbi:hypothetical protein N7486_000602 [Penicillium sp. IBT 16267x]|nr:hypothetical protein N7486_000602 [Penicillium sp. IBT 16267x]
MANANLGDGRSFVVFASIYRFTLIFSFDIKDVPGHSPTRKRGVLSNSQPESFQPVYPQPLH